MMMPDVAEIGVVEDRSERKKSVISGLSRQILFGLVPNLPNFLQTQCILIESAHRIFWELIMSLPSETPLEPDPPCSGNDCDLDVIVPLDWHSLSLCFDDEVIEAGLGAHIDQGLADMQCQLSQFTTKSSSSRHGR